MLCLTCCVDRYHTVAITELCCLNVRTLCSFTDRFTRWTCYVKMFGCVCSVFSSLHTLCMTPLLSDWTVWRSYQTPKIVSWYPAYRSLNNAPNSCMPTWLKTLHNEVERMAFRGQIKTSDQESKNTNGTKWCYSSKILPSLSDFIICLFCLFSKRNISHKILRVILSCSISLPSQAD